MTRYRAQNNLLTPAVPCLFLYDTGEQTFTSSGVFHIWNTIKIKTSGFHYTADDDRFTLLTNTSGLFILEYECSFYTTDTNTDIIVTSDIYKNGAILEGATCKTMVSGDQTPIIRTAQSIHYIVYLEKGDYIQVKTTTSEDEIIQSGNTSRLLVNFLPMNGWDNDMAGRVSFKGQVMR